MPSREEPARWTATPGLAEFRFRTRNTWVDGTLNRAENPPFYSAGAEDTGRPAPHRHEIDEPPVLLGEDRGAGDLDVRGFLGLSGQVRPGFQEIRVKFHVKSDAPREKIEELMKLAERRSPVSDNVRKGVPVRFEVET